MLRIPFISMMIVLFTIHLKSQVVFIDVLDVQGSGQVTVPIVLHNAIDILSIQGSIQYDANVLELVDVNTGPDLFLSDLITNDNNPGFIIFSWFPNNLIPITLDNGDVFMTMTFNILSSEPTIVNITNSPTIIEVSTGNGTYETIVNPGLINSIGSSVISGNIFYDENEDCTFDNNELLLAHLFVKITGNNQEFYTYTDDLGNYSFNLIPGDWTVEIIPLNEYWLSCEPVVVSLELDSNDTLNFGTSLESDCQTLSINASTNFIRHCFSNRYTVNYCNNGLAMDDIFIEVTLPENTEFISASISYEMILDGLYRFNIGSLNTGQCGWFNLFFKPCEDFNLGDSFCSSFEIFPQSICDDITNWSGAHITVGTECIDNIVSLSINNIGDFDMVESQEYVVFENDSLLVQPTLFILESGQTLTLEFPANGSTYHIEATQVNDFPWPSMPSTSIEGCGLNTNGEYSRGFVTQFAVDDGTIFRDILCEEIVGSFDPNDKAGFPLGRGEDHIIEKNTDIEYKIRFQNTGTFYALNVVVIDTLPSFLDPTTMRGISSSHDFDLSISEQNILEFTFNNIMLPDSNTNLEASNGFLEFTISQQNDLPYGTIIENNAAIYFDFNDPIITNTTFHELGTLPLISSNEVLVAEKFYVNVFPNPTSEYFILTLSENSYPDLNFTLYNLQGQVFQRGKVVGEMVEINTSQLTSGTYFYKLDNNGGVLKSGKIVVKD